MRLDNLGGRRCNPFSGGLSELRAWLPTAARAGMAKAMTKHGVGAPAIMLQGGRQSPGMAARYTRRLTASEAVMFLQPPPWRATMIPRTMAADAVAVNAARAGPT